jgi:putative ABC transport system permease protein
MQQFLRLAIRNVFRNRRRTLLTMIMVAGGVAGLLLVGGFFAFLFQGLRENTIRQGLGHVQVYNAEYFQRDEKHVLDTGLDNYKGVMDAIRNTPHVRGVAPRIEFYGMASNGMKSSTFMATAVDPASESSMGFDMYMRGGRPIQEDAKSGGGVEGMIAEGLARSMNVKPGDGLTLLAVTADGALNGIDIDIVGIYTTGVRELDERALRITLPAAQRLLQSDRVTKVVVGLDKTENTDAAYDAIAARLGNGAALRKWIDLATFYRQVRIMFSGIFIFTGVIVFFLVVMSSANTLMMAMFERVREIGTMLAMGTPRSWIMALFVTEGAVTGVIGAIAGVVTGVLLGTALNHSGLKLPPPPTSNNPLPFKVLHVPELMIGASVVVIAVLIAASLFPAIRAARLRIVESLAHI